MQVNEARPEVVEIVDARASLGALVADGLANLVIWYDFALLGMLSTFVGQALVPTENAQLATAVVLAIFAAGFFTRPIGAAFWRKFDTRYGRGASHMAVIGGMTISTVLIGLLQDHGASGYTSLALLIVLRLAQGVFAGAELPGAVAQMVSGAPHGFRGRLSCWPMTINLSGYSTAGLVALAILALHGPAATFGEAWRFAFFFAVPLAAIALALRLGISGAVTRKKMNVVSSQVPMAPAADLSRKRDVALTLCSVLVYNASTGAFQVGVPWLLVSWANWSLPAAIGIGVLFGLAPLAFTLFGSFADRIGHLRMMTVGALGVCLLAYPCFALLGQGGGHTVLAFAIGFVLMGVLGGSIQGFLAERLPNRSPKVQLIYALSAAIFGGTSPFIINVIAYNWGQTVAAGSYYLVASGALSLVALLGIRIGPNSR